MQQSIELIRGTDGQAVQAVLCSITQSHIHDYENLWQDLLQRSGQDDKFWNWAFKQRVFLSRGNYEGYAIECAGRTEGLLLLETQQHRSQYQAQLVRGEPLVYVESIAAAPWNRRIIFRPPEFRGIGTTLLLFARQRSIELGYGGRVGLHSLPDSESFYDSQNMLRFDSDPDEYYDTDEPPLTYFEYPAR